MKTKKLGQDSAFPIIGESAGMSKRLYLAAMAMQGILANPSFVTKYKDGDDLINAVRFMSYMMADEMLKQENL